MILLSLNAHTLLFSASLLAFLAAALTLSLADANGTVRRAVVAWSQGMLCVGITLLLNFLRGQIPDHIPLVVANAAIMAFGLFTLLAYARLFDLRYPVGALACLYLMQLAAVVAFYLADAPRELAVLILCSLLTVELVWTAVLIFRYGKASSAIRWAAAAMTLVPSALFAARVVLTALGYSPSIDPSAQSKVQIVTLLVSSVAIVGSTIAFVLMVHDRQHREVLDNARRDPLTGVLTRRALFDELEALERQPGQEFALVMVDIDHFKSINDRYGHLGGDTVLAHVGSLLRGTTRSSDVVGRYGGEEFCVLLRRCSEDEAARFAARLVAVVAASSVRMQDGCAVAVTVSAGYAAGQPGAARPVDVPLARHILAQADGALYEAKRTGRNRTVAARSDTQFGSSPVATLSQGVMAV